MVAVLDACVGRQNRGEDGQEGMDRDGGWQAAGHWCRHDQVHMGTSNNNSTRGGEVGGGDTMRGSGGGKNC